MLAREKTCGENGGAREDGRDASEGALLPPVLPGANFASKNRLAKNNQIIVTKNSRKIDENPKNRHKK